MEKREQDMKYSKEYMEYMFGSEFMESKDKGTLKEYQHDCYDHVQQYDMTADGQRYHGWECSKCGKILQTG
tara:strand:- start:584 stop:796 length:213 start_codon:yes stop_codon:yes gene_type:complete